MESFRAAVSSLWSNKMRTFLTMLGIIIGISSVITIIALGQGSQAEIGSEFEKFGTNRIQIYMNWHKNPSYSDYFDMDDVETIERLFKDKITAVSPSDSTSAKITRGREEGSVYIYGVSEQYEKLEKFDLIEGRFLQPSDLKSGRSVAVIDKTLALELFKTTDVVGEKILAENSYSKVSMIIIGVYEKPQSTFDRINQEMEGVQNTVLYFPVTAMKKFGYGTRFYSIEANIAPEYDIKQTMDEIISVMERKHRVVGKELYNGASVMEQMNIVGQVLDVVSGVIGAIAAISLVVGGIGVMNIMLVSVTERTREIGVRKAIGATRKDILIQFLIESMIISGLGGVIGTVLGTTVQMAIALILKLQPRISVPTILLAVTFSAVVGIFFGVYPANKASKLDPIEALRYE